MHEFTKRIEVDRPPAAVWPYLTEANKIQLLANLETIEQQPQGPVEKGTRWQQTIRLLGKKMETTDEAIEVEEARRLVVRSLDSPFPYTFEYTLQEQENTTTVALHVEMGDTKGFFGKFAEPVVAKIMEHEFRGQLERLKAFAEANGS